MEKITGDLYNLLPKFWRQNTKKVRHLVFWKQNYGIQAHKASPFYFVTPTEYILYESFFFM